MCAMERFLLVRVCRTSQPLPGSKILSVDRLLEPLPKDMCLDGQCQALRRRLSTFAKMCGAAEGTNSGAHSAF